MPHSQRLPLDFVMLVVLLAVKASLSHLASRAAAPSNLTPIQYELLLQARATAAEASRRATPEVLTAFEDPIFRKLLQRALQPASATTLDPMSSSTTLLERFRAEVRIAEAVYAFQSPWLSGGELPLADKLNTTSPINLWQYQIMAAAGGSRQTAVAVADRAGT